MRKLIRTKLFAGAAALLFVFIALLANVVFSQVTTKAAEICLVAGTDFTLSGSNDDLKATLGEGYSLVGQAGSSSNGYGTFVSAASYSRKKATIIKFTTPIETKEIKTMRLGISKNISATAYFDFYANVTGSVIDGTSAVRSATVSSATDVPTYIDINTVDYANENGVIESIVVVHESDDKSEDYAQFTARFFSIDCNKDVILTAGTDFCYTDTGIEASAADGYTPIGQAGAATNATLGKFVSVGMRRQYYSLIKFSTPLNVVSFKSVSFKMGKNIGADVTYDFYKNDSSVTVGNSAQSVQTVVFSSASNGGGADTEATVNTITLDLLPFADDNGLVYGFIMAHTDDKRADGDYSGFNQRMYNMTASVRTDNVYKVTFNSNGGTAVSNQWVSGENAKATKPEDPVKDGLVFDYWYTDDENVPYDFNSTVNSDLVLNAKWTNLSLRSITCKSSGNGVVSSSTDQQYYTKSVTVTITPDKYYSIQSVFNNGTDVSAEITDGEYTFVMPDEDVEIVVEFVKAAEYGLKIGEDFVLTGENNLGLEFPAAVGPVTESATGYTKYFANGINSANGTVVRFTENINIADYNTAVIEYKLGADTYPRSLVFVKNLAGATLDDREYVCHTDAVKGIIKKVSVDLRALANEGEVESFVFSLGGETQDHINVYGITLTNVNYGEEKELEPYVGYHLRSDPDLSDKLVGSFNDINVSGDNFVSTKAAMRRGYGTAVKFAERVSTDEYSAITFDISKNTSDNVVFAIYRLEKDGAKVKTFTVGGAANVTTAVTIRLADIAIDGKCEGFILVHESDDRGEDYEAFSVRIYPISLKTYRQVSFKVENVDITTQTLAYGDVITEPTAPTKEKDEQFVYTFDGWYVGDVKWNFSNPVTENVVLTARFIQTANISVKMSVALSEDIIVRFAFDDSAYTDIEFTVNGIKVEKIDGKYLYDEIVPQHLGKELVINVTGKNSEGETVRLVNDKRYSVKEYLFELLGKTAEELGYTDEQFGLMKSLVTDLLYYGKAAQDYTGYETDNYVTAGLEESPSEFVCPTSVKNTTDNTGDYTWYSAKLRYSDKIRLVFTVLGTEQPTGVIFNVGGKEISVTEGILKESEDGKNKYEYVLDISLVDFDTVITGKIVVGEQTLAPQITYSVASYIAVQTENPLIDEVEKELLKRAYCYGVSATKFAKSLAESI